MRKVVIDIDIFSPNRYIDAIVIKGVYFFELPKCKYYNYRKL